MHEASMVMFTILLSGASLLQVVLHAGFLCGVPGSAVRPLLSPGRVAGPSLKGGRRPCAGSEASGALLYRNPSIPATPHWQADPGRAYHNFRSHFVAMNVSRCTVRLSANAQKRECAADIRFCLLLLGSFI